MTTKNKAYYLRPTSEMSLKQLYEKLSHKIYNPDVDMILNNHFKKGVVKVEEVFRKKEESYSEYFDLENVIFKVSFTIGGDTFIKFILHINSHSTIVKDAIAVRPRKITSIIYVE